MGDLLTLSSLWADIVTKSKAAGIDPIVMVAVADIECGWSTSWEIRNIQNSGGCSVYCWCSVESSGVYTP